MNNIIESARSALRAGRQLPFRLDDTAHSRFDHVSLSPQPVLLIVYSGHKEIIGETITTVTQGQFLFLPGMSRVSIRNIGKHQQHCSLAIYFSDHEHIELIRTKKRSQHYITGQMDHILTECIHQFINWSALSPTEMWSSRRAEIINTIFQIGYPDVAKLFCESSLSETIEHLLIAQDSTIRSAESVCRELAISETTLRRKLRAENTSFREIKDRTLLNLGLNLLQNTHDSIELIAYRCGYESPSRFSERFKRHFGATPSSMRKARLADNS